MNIKNTLGLLLLAIIIAYGCIDNSAEVIARLQLENGELEQKIDSLEFVVTEIKFKLNLIEAEADTLYFTALKAIQQRDSLIEIKDSLDNELVILNATVIDLQNQIITKDGTITALQDQLNVANSDILDLQNQLTISNDSIISLNNTVTLLNITNNALQGDLTVANDSIATLNTDLELFNERVDTMLVYINNGLIDNIDSIYARIKANNDSLFYILNF